MWIVYNKATGKKITSYTNWRAAFNYVSHYPQYGVRSNA